MSIVLDPETTDTTSPADGGAEGTYPGMSPELFYLAESNLSKPQLTTKLVELWNVAQERGKLNTPASL
jgi:hypothetical protein